MRGDNVIRIYLGRYPKKYQPIDFSNIWYTDWDDCVAQLMETYSLADTHDIYLSRLDDAKHNIEVFYSDKLKHTFEEHVRSNLEL